MLLEVDSGGSSIDAAVELFNLTVLRVPVADVLSAVCGRFVFSLGSFYWS